MGHDYIDIETSSLRLNDLHIWTLRHFFCDSIATSTPDAFDTDPERYSRLEHTWSLGNGWDLV